MCLLLANPDIRVTGASGSASAAGATDATGEAGKAQTIVVDLVRLLERLDEELTRSLRNIDQHSADYIARLSDDAVLYNLICLTERYCERLTTADLCRVRLLRLEHVYYKSTYVPLTARGATKMLPSRVEDRMERDIPTAPEQISGPVPEIWAINDEEEANVQALVDRLCKYLYKHSKGRIAIRGVLCHVFNLALFDKWNEARDLMLMSHLQDKIVQADIPTQILYNRALVQLGLCAFRAGNISQAQAALNEIMQMSRAKELLAQGYRYRYDKSQKQIAEEKMRQTPFHMHIKLEVLEATYYTASMLMEIPSIAQVR